MERATKRPAAPADPMVPSRYRVVEKRRETSDTWTLDLEPVDAERALEFAPGQFNMVYVFGIGESAISISGDPSARGPLTHTVRAVGRVTEAICASEPGAVLGIRGPYGTPWPVADSAGRDVFVVAGGVGLAPLRPVVQYVLRRRDAFGRAVLLYGGRSPDQLLFSEELDRWIEGGFELEVTVDTATRGWRGRVGVVPALIERFEVDPAATVGFTCGPEVMMRFTAQALLDRGVDAGDVHVSMERNMKCAVGHCGHCQLGPTFVCKEGPVFTWGALEPFLKVREL